MRTYIFRFLSTSSPKRPPKKHRHTGAGRYPLPRRGLVITRLPGSTPGMTHTKKFRNPNPNNRIFIIWGLIGQSRNTKGTQWIPACAGMTTKNNKAPPMENQETLSHQAHPRHHRRGPGSPLDSRGVVIPPLPEFEQCS